MDSRTLFQIDGVGYRVNVLKLTRKFAVLDTENSGRTLDGQMYREPIGTFYNYSMVVSPSIGYPEELEAFWQKISQPETSFTCKFPYGQQYISQKMYVTSGEQNLVRAADDGNLWGEVTLNFIAMAPRVLP